MNETKNEKLYRIAAATCFAIFCACSITKTIIYVHGGIPSWKTMALWIVYCGIAVSSYCKKKNVGLLIFTGVGAIFSVLDCISYLRMGYLWFLIAWIVFFMLFLINIVPAMKKYAGLTRVLAFIPGGLHLIGSWCIVAHVRPIWSSVTYVVLSAGMIFTGLWLRASVNTSSVPAAARTVSAAADYQQNIYDQQLKNGIITQAEYDQLTGQKS